MHDMHSRSPSVIKAFGHEFGSGGGDADPAWMNDKGLQMFRPHPLLSDIVEDIWDVDVPDGNVARRITIAMPPTAYALVALQYRVPLRCKWSFGRVSIPRATYRHIAVRMHSGITTARATGSIGAVMVRIKPEFAHYVTRATLSEFFNRKTDLCDVFDRFALAQVEDQLVAAPDALARVAIVERLLLQQMRPLRPAVHLMQAVSRLRFDPSLSIHDLALQLDVSARHLSRGFKAAFGTGPKSFARLARVEKAVTARRDGLDWTSIAHACGFADQAHLIHDFHDIVGTAPEQVLRPPGMTHFRRFWSPRVRLFFNLFVG